MNRLLILLFLPFYLVAQPASDVLIFSYNRPLQLYALLESLKLYVAGMGKIHVIYRASEQQYENAYQEVYNDFPAVIAKQQGNNPEQDFKQLTLQSFNELQEEYIVFAVDDIVVTGYIDLHECVEQLKQTNAYGFYLRLGKNITYCYAHNKPEQVPPLQQITENVFAWRFNTATYDWGYPNTVDMTVYKKSDIAAALHSLRYSAPNTLEGRWAGTAGSIKNRLGLCYKHSKMVNLPLNKVQTVNKNRHMNFATPQELLDIFNSGLKISTADLCYIDNSSPHMEYEPVFIEREIKEFEPDNNW